MSEDKATDDAVKNYERSASTRILKRIEQPEDLGWDRAVFALGFEHICYRADDSGQWRGGVALEKRQ